MQIVNISHVVADIHINLACSTMCVQKLNQQLINLFIRMLLVAASVPGEWSQGVVVIFMDPFISISLDTVALLYIDHGSL